jgi:hypothetical protein
MRMTILLAALITSFAQGVAAQAEKPQRILFIGNSFTFAQGSAVRYFHPEKRHRSQWQCAGRHAGAVQGLRDAGRFELRGLT